MSGVTTPTLVLLVEDDLRLATLTREYLEGHGVAVVHVGDGKRGEEEALTGRYDAVLLDLMLPGKDGLEVCREIRGRSDVPVIVLTARGEEADRVLGLELGADDYVVKPFSPRELVARARAGLRRQRRAPDTGETVSVREVRLDASTQDVTVRGIRVELSTLEFRLLYTLAAHPRQIFSRERLLDEVWGDDRSVTPRTVDVHIRRLREKIEMQPDEPEYIGTVRGAGYRFLAEPAGQPLPD